jgi:hypothetical protein
MALVDCPTHGMSGVILFSSDLLSLRADGTLPESILVEVGETVSEMNFFRFNVSPGRAESIPNVNGCIPFDLEACEILDTLEDMCIRCFSEKRAILASLIRPAQ